MRHRGKLPESTIEEVGDNYQVQEASTRKHDRGRRGQAPGTRQESTKKHERYRVQVPGSDVHLRGGREQVPSTVGRYQEAQ